MLSTATAIILMPVGCSSFDPGLPVLQTGDHCRVGIPPTIGEGDHASHLAAWSRLAAAAPLGLEHQSMPGPAGHEPPRDRDRVSAETRAELLGMTLTQILRVLLRSWARRRVVGGYADELEAISLRRLSDPFSAAEPTG